MDDEEPEPEIERQRRLAGSRPVSMRPRRRPRQIDLAQAIELQQYALESDNASALTIAQYHRVEGLFVRFLNEFLGVNPPGLDALTVDNTRAWIHALQVRGLSSGTIRQYVTVVKVWARFLQREGVVREDRLRRLRSPRATVPVVETLSPDQLTALVLAAEHHPFPRRTVAMIYFLVATGVRVSEFSNLARGDVDLKAGRAKVLGKGSKERFVHFDPVTARLLLRYLVERNDDEPWLFLDRDNGRWTRNAIGTVLRDLGRAARVVGVRVSPHTFRHTFAVNYLRAHPDAVLQLQLLLGHESLDMTRRYVRFAKAEGPVAGPSVVSLLGLDRLMRGR